MKQFAPKNWNDVLSLILIVGICAIWISRVNIEGEVNGALIATFTLVVQYYFRRSPQS